MLPYYGSSTHLLIVVDARLLNDIVMVGAKPLKHSAEWIQVFRLNGVCSKAHAKK